MEEKIQEGEIIDKAWEMMPWSLSEAQINLLKKSIPETFTKPVAYGQRRFTNIDPYYVIYRLNEVFGLCGLGWQYEIVEVKVFEQPKEVATRIRFRYYVRVGDLGDWSEWIEAWGNMNAGTSWAEAHKGSVTNAICKAASILGVGAEIYLGGFIGQEVGDILTKNEEKTQKSSSPPEKKSKKIPSENQKKRGDRSGIWKGAAKQGWPERGLRIWIRRNYGKEHVSELDNENFEALRVTLNNWAKNSETFKGILEDLMEEEPEKQEEEEEK